MILRSLHKFAAWIVATIARIVVWVAVNGDPFAGKVNNGCPNCGFLLVTRPEYDSCPHCGWGPETEPEKTAEEARKDFLRGVEKHVKVFE